MQGKLEDEPGMTVAAWQQRPESHGHCLIRSADPVRATADRSEISLSVENDRQVLLGGIKLARELSKSAPLAPFYDYEAYPGEDIQSDDELLAMAQRARHHDLPPDGHLPDGAGDRHDVGGLG